MEFLTEIVNLLNQTFEPLVAGSIIVLSGIGAYAVAYFVLDILFSISRTCRKIFSAIARGWYAIADRIAFKKFVNDSERYSKAVNRSYKQNEIRLDEFMRERSFNRYFKQPYSY